MGNEGKLTLYQSEHLPFLISGGHDEWNKLSYSVFKNLNENVTLMLKDMLHENSHLYKVEEDSIIDSNVFKSLKFNYRLSLAEPKNFLHYSKYCKYIHSNLGMKFSYESLAD